MEARTDRLARLRQEYADAGLSDQETVDDPMGLFGRWLDAALSSGLHEANAMTLATVDTEGRPAARLVLLKELTAEGFCFFTNYESRKSEELRAEPRCALVFPWHPLQRQVRVEGVAKQLSEAASAAYFTRRPRGSQLGAWASPQSRVVADRQALDAAYHRVEERFAGVEEVPRPPHWGGWRVEPLLIEFWQGRPGRMHDRLRFARSCLDTAAATDRSWHRDRLAP